MRKNISCSGNIKDANFQGFYPIKFHINNILDGQVKFINTFIKNFHESLKFHEIRNTIP